MKRPLSALCASSLLIALSSGCTLIVWRDASTPAACDDDEDCPAGEGCVDEVCEVVDPGAVPAEGTRIDIAGGTVVGVDGVELEVPAGAVNAATIFVVRRETSTLPRDNFDATGSFYAVTPAVSFAIPALLLLPGDDDDDAFLQPVDAGAGWQTLTQADDGRFELLRTGVVARGQAVTP